MRPKDVPEGPLCIDTDAFSLLYLRKDPHRRFRELVDGHLLVVSFATIGELRAGAIKARWGEARRANLERVLRENHLVLTATDAVVESYAQLQARFAVRLKGGGVNDMWTAACALAQPEPVPIVTNNFSDFQVIAEEFPLALVHPDLRPPD